jgi:hypothetical protein
MDLQDIVLRWDSFVGSGRDHEGEGLLGGSEGVVGAREPVRIRHRSAESTAFMDRTIIGNSL